MNPVLPETFQNVTLIHAGNSLAQPDVYGASVDGRNVLAKTFQTKPLLVRLLFGRKTLLHEHGILSRLQDLPNVPRVYEMPDPDTLLMEYVAGHGCIPDARNSEVGEMPSVHFFAQLKDVLHALHERGVSHGDIRRRNILWAADDRPVLIDFGTAVYCHGRLSFLRRAAFNLCRRADAFAVVKIQESCCPGSLTKEEERLLAELPWHLRLGRFFKQKIYRRFIKQRIWRRRMKRLHHRLVTNGLP